MKIRILISVLIVIVALTAAFGAVAAFADNAVTVCRDKVTVMYVSECCSGFEGNLYRETNLGDPYFDGVRSGDFFEIPINVEESGEYHFCFMFGWVDATGNYTVDIDGNTVNLQNTVVGRGWRDWVDTSEQSITLTAGRHTLRVTNNTAGPNIRGFKIAPVGVPLSINEGGGVAQLFDPGMQSTAIAISGTYAAQFNINSPFSYISLDAASWNNNIGSLRLSLYKWKSSYSETLRGESVMSKDFVDFPDNSVLRLEGQFESGEYILHIENISQSQTEEVGFWAWNGTSDKVRSYKDDAEVQSCARLSVKYDQDTDIVFGGLSPVQSDGEELAPSEFDLFPWDESKTYPMGKTDIIGVQFKTEKVFGGCEVYISSTPAHNAELTVSLYKWAGNYSGSVKLKPIATRKFVDIRRSDWLKLDGDFEAGEYLLVMSDVSERYLACLPFDRSESRQTDGSRA